MSVGKGVANYRQTSERGMSRFTFENVPELDGSNVTFLLSAVEGASIEQFFSHFGVVKQEGSCFEGYIGSWPVFGMYMDDGYRIFEWNRTGSERIEGADVAYSVWCQQFEVCKQLGYSFQPPSAVQLIAVAPDFATTREFEGYRLKAPPQMSGWWVYPFLMEEQPDYSSFRPECVYHCIVRQPVITQYLALPVGCRFFQPARGVTFDPSLLE